MEIPQNPENFIPPDFSSAISDEVFLMEDKRLLGTSDLLKASASPEYRHGVSFSKPNSVLPTEELKKALAVLIEEFKDLETQYRSDRKDGYANLQKAYRVAERYRNLCISLKEENSELKRNNKDLNDHIMELLKTIASRECKVETSIFQHQTNSFPDESIKSLAKDINTIIYNISRNQKANYKLTNSTIEHIRKDKNLFARTMSALKAGSGAALEELISHPVSSFVIAFLQDIADR